MAELVEMAARCRNGTPEWFVPYLGAEQEATRIRFWAPTAVPGLLQSEGYMRALEKSNAIVTRQQERQAQVIGRASVVAVLDHRVLAFAIGSASVMAEQCAYLVGLAESDKIRLHIVPEGANVGLGGAVAIASKGGHVTLNMATMARDIASTEASIVEETLAEFELVLGSALDPVQSVEFVRQREARWKEDGDHARVA